MTWETLRDYVQELGEQQPDFCRFLREEHQPYLAYLASSDIDQAKFDQAAKLNEYRWSDHPSMSSLLECAFWLDSKCVGTQNDNDPLSIPSYSNYAESMARGPRSRKPQVSKYQSFCLCFFVTFLSLPETIRSSLSEIADKLLRQQRERERQARLETQQRREREKEAARQEREKQAEINKQLEAAALANHADRKRRRDDDKEQKEEEQARVEQMRQETAKQRRLDEEADKMVAKQMADAERRAAENEQRGRSESAVEDDSPTVVTVEVTVEGCKSVCCSFFLFLYHLWSFAN